MKDLDLYSWIALSIVLVGGINSGFMGLFDVNLFSAILGNLLGRLLLLVVAGGAGYLCYLIYLLKFKKV